MPTLKELKEQARAHNKRSCIKLSQRKAGLVSSLASVSNALTSHSQNNGSSSSASTSKGKGKGKGPAVKMKKKKRIAPTLVSSTVGGSSSAGMMPGNVLGGGGAGSSVGQKNFKKKLKKQKTVYKKLKGADANPEYAFDI